MMMAGGFIIIGITCLLGFILIVGLVIFTIGRLKKDKNNSLTKTGLIVAGILIGLVALIFLLGGLDEILTVKPNKADLVGTYHIVKVTGLDFDVNTYDNYKLQFYDNGTFTMTQTPYIQLCDSGEYDVDYQFDYNELSFHCFNNYRPAHIVRNIGDFQIEFTIGDPDSYESIFFEKTNK